MIDKAIPYFFVLNEAGVVIYKSTGVFSEKKMEEIEAALEKK